MTKIIIIIFVLLIVGLIVYLTTTKANNVKAARQTDIVIDNAINFGYKCMWIAVKMGDKEKIAEILGLVNAHPSNWKTGIEEANNNKIFITPEVGDWTLVVGNGLAARNSKSLLEEAESYGDKINKLSKVFGEAQFFLTNRIVEYHIWAKAINGKTERFYSFIGERGENILIEGEPTAIEKKI